MQLAPVRELHDATPFRPFRIHLSDGRDFPVQHREYMGIFPDGTMLLVLLPDGATETIDLFQATSVTVSPKPKRARNGRTSAS